MMDCSVNVLCSRTFVLLCSFLLTVNCEERDVIYDGISQDGVPLKTSNDLYMDPCKADGFLGDIALSPSQYGKAASFAKEYQNELLIKNAHRSTPANNAAVEEPSIGQPRIVTRIQRMRAREARRQRRRQRRLQRLQRKEQRQARRRQKRVKTIQRRKPTHTLHNESSLDNAASLDDGDDVENVNETDSHATDDRDERPHDDDDDDGDDVVTHLRTKRAATGRPERLWDHAVIPYVIASNFSGAHKALFQQAMRHWENYTCVTFIERTLDDYNYIIFTERPCGCCSFVGQRGNGPQAISIGKNCDKFGIVVHELGHVVGFWHEHTRPDRDDHVDIITKNIMPGQEYNFNKLSETEVQSLGERYDYSSIMHYAQNTFSRNSYVDTILPKHGAKVEEDLPEDMRSVLIDDDGKPEIGQRVRLSPGDIRQTNKLYKCPKCGRTYQESSATFSSPLANGEKEMTCQWRITATHGEIIVLNITQIDIPESTDCYLDYLEVRDGHWLNSALLGRFCGSGKLPGTLVTTGSRMWIEYRASRPSEQYKGFTASYEAVCGGEVVKESGSLTSPNYPDYYKPNKDCVWKITVQEGYSVALKFSAFEIENHDNCVYDYLEVRDGHADDSSLIGRFCGYKIPDDIKSTSNKLYVKFVSDGSVNKAGFVADFIKEYDECSTEVHGCEHKCVNTLGGYRCECHIGYELHSDGKKCEDACGGYIDATNGTIQTPSYPDLYPSNKNCVWQIVAPPLHRITLNFTHFDMEGNNQDCEYDSVEVRSGPPPDSTLHGLYCGSAIPQPITSDGKSLRIEFSSDNSVQKTGFHAVFLTDKDECQDNNGGCQHICKNTIGGFSCACHNGYTLHSNHRDCKEGGCQHQISTPNGEITSPNWPESYPSRKNCVWHFSSVPGHRIKLIFNDFQLEPHLECNYDHVELFDSDDNKGRSLGRFCGSGIPDPVIASSNKLYMVFYSDASVQKKGFHARHTTVCGGRLTATTSIQELFSHAKYGDQSYENKQECDWVIDSPPGTKVQIKFRTFEVEDERDCGYDYVELYDGKTTSDRLIKRYCGNEPVPDTTSTGDSLLVRFKSDDTIGWKGFFAVYYIKSGDEKTAHIGPARIRAAANRKKDADEERAVL